MTVRLSSSTASSIVNEERNRDEHDTVLSLIRPVAVASSHCSGKCRRRYVKSCCTWVRYKHSQLSVSHRVEKKFLLYALSLQQIICGYTTLPWPPTNSAMVSTAVRNFARRSVNRMQQLWSWRLPWSWYISRWSGLTMTFVQAIDYWSAKSEGPARAILSSHHKSPQVTNQSPACQSLDVVILVAAFWIYNILVSILRSVFDVKAILYTVQKPNYQQEWNLCFYF